MARPLPVDFTGELYHVMLPGGQRRMIGHDDVERERHCFGVGAVPQLEQ